MDVVPNMFRVWGHMVPKTDMAKYYCIVFKHIYVLVICAFRGNFLLNLLINCYGRIMWS